MIPGAGIDSQEPRNSCAEAGTWETHFYTSNEIMQCFVLFHFSEAGDGKRGSSVRLGHALSVSVVNSLWTILTGTRGAIQ